MGNSLNIPLPDSEFIELTHEINKTESILFMSDEAINRYIHDIRLDEETIKKINSAKFPGMDIPNSWKFRMYIYGLHFNIDIKYNLASSVQSYNINTTVSCLLMILYIRQAWACKWFINNQTDQGNLSYTRY